jgi:hypothetical protein
MKALTNFRRNDVIRIVALASVVAFPLIADAQLGLGSKAVALSKDVSPPAEDTAKAGIAAREPCANQHWPYFSAECLHGPVPAREPRLVSVSVEPAPAPPAAVATARPAVTGTAAAREKVLAAQPKRPVKSRMATHNRQRSKSSVTYAVNPEVRSISLAER